VYIIPVEIAKGECTAASHRKQPKGTEDNFFPVLYGSAIAMLFRAIKILMLCTNEN
jgi:hypothetical protein